MTDSHLITGKAAPLDIANLVGYRPDYAQAVSATNRQKGSG